MDDIEKRLLDMAREVKHIDPTAKKTLENDPEYLCAQAATMQRMMEIFNSR